MRQQLAKERVAESLHGKVRRALEESRLLEGPLLVVAVSGGADSMALLHSLVCLQAPLGLRLHGAHLNHGLRGSQGRDDADFVAGAFQGLGLAYTLEEVDVPSLRAKWRMSVEEAARKARYDFLSEVAHSAGAHAVALGHTADDQAETVLMHLLRGAGLSGLRGMQTLSQMRMRPQGRPVTLLRPFLQVSRRETHAYCSLRGIEYRPDPSNLSLEHTRNRLRHELLPALREYNPAVNEALLRLSRTAAQGVAHLDAHVEEIWPRIARSHEWGLSLNRREVSSLDLALQSHLLMRTVAEVRGDPEGITAFHIQEMIRLIGGPAGKSLDLPGGVTLSVGYREITLAAQKVEQPLPPSLEGEYGLQVPGETEIPGYAVECSLVEGRQETGDESAYTACMDLDSVGRELWVRARKPGDRFQPLGMAQEKKLQDFMVDCKVPRQMRDRVPLLVTPRGIAWVVGHRIAHWAKLRPDTQGSLLVRFKPDHSTFGY